MDAFNFVIFGFTSNLAQLKIIPALYDLEAKGLLDNETRIIGIGRKQLIVRDYIENILHTENRHHLHKIDLAVANRLIDKIQYIQEDFENSDNLFLKLKELRGNALYYLATYPDLYKGIFDNLKKYGLNTGVDGWTKIMIEKPIGNNFESSRQLNELLSNYFDQGNIFRVDHYLGKEDLEDIFNEKISSNNVDSIQLSVTEDFGVGKRGVYYDATGALTDMGQNHFMQMIAGVAKEDLTVAAREKVIESLVPEKDQLVFGQYEGYLSEDNINPNSKTDTFFALRTHLSGGEWKDIPIYMRSGKMLGTSEVKISLIYKNGSTKSWVITSTGVGKKYDPYEKLIIEAVAGNQFYFNSAKEVEASWKFIDALANNTIQPIIYKKGSMGPKEADDLIQKDGGSWL